MSVPIFLFVVHGSGAIAVLLTFTVLMFAPAGRVRHRLRRSEGLFPVPRRSYLLAVGNATFNNTSYALLFFAIQGGAILQAAVVFELWSTVFLLLSLRFRSGRDGEFRLHHGLPTTVVFFVLGAIGVVVVAVVGFQGGGGGVTIPSNFALACAFLAPIAMAISFFIGTANSRLISEYLSPNQEPDQSDNALSALLSSTLLRVFSILLISAALVLGGQLDPTGLMLIFSQADTVVPLLLCGLVVAVGGSLSTLSNNITKTSNVNLIFYFVPFIALVFLLAFGQIDSLPREAYFGVVLILASNYILTSPYEQSFSFRAAISMLCFASTWVFFLPSISGPPHMESIAIILGLFGILAAFLIDRVYKEAASRSGISEASQPRDAAALMFHGQNVFVLWLLGFGACTAIFVFRTGDNSSYDFLAIVIAVAVVYISLLPVDMVLSSKDPVDPADDASRTLKALLTRLAVSVLFLLSLFSLLLVGLLTN